MKRYTAQETLQILIDLLLNYLNDMSEVNSQDENQFSYGEKTAYTECLEVVQLWERAFENGLNFDIEFRFPL